MKRTSIAISRCRPCCWAPLLSRRRRRARLTRTSRRPEPPPDRNSANTFVNLCLPSAPRGGGAGRGGAALAARRGGAARGAGAPQTPDRANWYAPPFKVFDNLYWLGTRQHSSWALQTSAGDHHHRHEFRLGHPSGDHRRPDQARPESEDIKYVIISHAHGDHDQGAAELQERYSAQVVMGAADWDATLKRPPPRRAACRGATSRWGPKAGNSPWATPTIEIVATPGHTAGTLSYVFPVKDQGKTVMVAYSGGTLTGAFGTDGARWDEYIASQRKIAKGGR